MLSECLTSLIQTFIWRTFVLSTLFCQGRSNNEACEVTKYTYAVVLESKSFYVFNVSLIKAVNEHGLCKIKPNAFHD